jgi:hypothetical protein
MSMVGFHGVEKALGKPIMKMADALAAQYSGIEKVGVIHMRPAAKCIAQIFGDRAITPDARV